MPVQAADRRGERFALGDRVSPDQRSFFDEYGFIVFASVFSAAEVAILREEADRLRARTLAGEIPNSDIDDLTPRGTDPNGNVVLHRLLYLTRYSPRTRALVTAPRVRSIGEGLLGEGAWLLEDTLYGVIWQLKSGGCNSSYSAIRWHADYPDDHVLAPVVAVGIYLNESTRENGCLTVLPASHRLPSVPPIALPIEARPGDVVCHAHNLLHKSGPVQDEAKSRATVYLYFCGGAHPGRNLGFAEAEKREIRKLFVAG